MNYRYRKSNLKLKPPNPERQKAFLQKLKQDLDDSHNKHIEASQKRRQDWLEFISDPNRKIKKDNSVQIFIWFWIIYFIILWLV
jgi:hypothetical protein